MPAHSDSEVHVSYGADDGGIGLGKMGREELVQFEGVRPYALQSDREAESPSLRFCQSLLGGSPPPVNKSVWINSYVEGVSTYQGLSPSWSTTETDTPGSDPELFLVAQPNGGITREPFGGCNGPPHCDYGEVRVPGCTHNASGSSLVAVSYTHLTLPTKRIV